MLRFPVGADAGGRILEGGRTYGIALSRVRANGVVVGEDRGVTA
jgi:hypothetical protein